MKSEFHGIARCPAVVAVLMVGLIIFCSGTVTAQGNRQAAKRLTPTHVNVRYGDHERNVLDLYLADADEPTPLVLYIHGGGFRGGDKRSLNPREGKALLDAGFSIAAINYRLTDTAPMPAAYLDCGRALQFLRHHAKKWNLNPQLVASTGGSAGAGTSMWLAFHDDLADSDSDDPVARQSTRLTCVAVRNGQSSYDPRFAEMIGLPRPNFERHPFFLPFYGINKDEIDTPRAHKLYDHAAPVTYVSKDDPPALLHYSFPNVEVDRESALGLVVHHPKFGIALKRRLDKLQVECIVQYPKQQGGALIRHGEDQPSIQTVDFIRQHFELAKKRIDASPAHESTESAKEHKQDSSASASASDKDRSQEKSRLSRQVAELLDQLDESEDGVLDESELPKPLAKFFAPLDKNLDGKFSASELRKMRGRPGKRRGEIITPAAREERYDDTLEVGDHAPDFTLSDPKGQKNVTLSSFCMKKPVVLIFGSYT